MSTAIRNCDGLSYEERWALWQEAKAVSRRIRARKGQRTSSARRTRASFWQRVRGLIGDVTVSAYEVMPTFRSVLSGAHGITARLFGRTGSEWRFADVIRRQPGLTAWCLVFLAIVIVVRFSDRQPAPADVTTDQQRWLRARAAEAVSETLATIGHGIKIHRVEAKPLAEGTLGHYRWWEKAIAVNSDYTFSESGLLDVAAHECVHAVFYQAGLWPSPTHPRQYGLLKESAAYVLGAHIAGRVWSRRGFDGEALANRLVNGHREACDPTLPDSVHWRIAESYGPDGRSWLTPKEELSLSGHFGSPKIVDEMDRICRLNSEPLDAARAIAERFGRRVEGGDRPSANRTDLRPTD